MNDSSWLLAVTADSLVRVELKDDGSVGPARLFSRRGETAGAAARPVLETLPKRAGVWIWLADAWCQTLTLEAGAGGDPARWAREAEPFSGVRAAESSAVGESVPAAGGGLACRIFQAPRRDLEALAAACRAAKCRLLGVGHPGQLSPLTDADGLPAEAGAFAEDDAEPLAQDWWTRARSGRLPPLLSPAKAPGAAGASSARRGLACAGLLLLAAVAAAGWTARWRADALRDANESLRALDADARRIEARAAALRREADALVADHEAGLAPRRALQALRGQTPALYDCLLALSEGGAPPLLPVRAIRSPEPFVHEIVLLARSPEAMDAALQDLSARLAPKGLSVAPLEAGWADGGTQWRVLFRVEPGDRPAAASETPEVW